MGILSDRRIIEEIKLGNIYIEGFNEEKELRKYDGEADGSYKGKLGPNGYDLTLNEKLYVYTNNVLDCKKNEPKKEIIIPEEGYVLQPGILYIGCVNEYTKTHNYVPALEGRSSLARFGLSIHQTSGFGDDGFEGRFTCEFTVIHPLRVYPDMRIAQIVYHQTIGKVLNKYNGKYQFSENPEISKMYQDNEFNRINDTSIYESMKQLQINKNDITEINLNKHDKHGLDCSINTGTLDGYNNLFEVYEDYKKEYLNTLKHKLNKIRKINEEVKSKKGFTFNIIDKKLNLSFILNSEIKLTNNSKGELFLIFKNEKNNYTEEIEAELVQEFIDIVFYTLKNKLSLMKF